MKKAVVFLLCAVMLFAAVSCTPTVTPPDGDGGSDSDGVNGRFSDNETMKNKDFYKDYTAAEKDLYYLLWKDTTKVVLKIDIEPKELAKINEAYESHDAVKADTYRKCNLTITVNGTDYRFDEVGIRMRGNTSRGSFCDGNGKIYNLVHFRFSLSETFDGEEYAAGAWASDIAQTWQNTEQRDARKNRTFATMSKFFYKWNKNYDNTYVREVYANKMFQAYGVLAPHITLVQVLMKQQGQFENLGVGTLYETVDKQFLKRNFSKEEAKGDLYKCAYMTAPADLTTADGRGVETPNQRFNYALKTNDDRTAVDYNHHKYLIALIDMLKTSNTDVNFQSKLEAIVDMNYFTHFEAVNYLLGNPDCIRNNANNYYMYFLPESGKVFFIPYDYDRCLGINVDWNPSGNGMTKITPYSTKGAVGTTRNPLYAKTILSSGTERYRETYKSKLKEVLAGDWFTYTHFKSMFEKYKANYGEAALPSQTILSQCRNLRADMLVFSERGTSDLSATNDNITTENYMLLKRVTAENNL